MRYEYMDGRSLVGGGFFTGRYTSPDAQVEPGSRFDPEKGQGKVCPLLSLSPPLFNIYSYHSLIGHLQNYRNRYWNDHYFRALSHIQSSADKHGLTLAEVALRWISHHSLLKREYGDAVIIGASSLKHIEENLVDLEKGPLREWAFLCDL